MHPFLCLGRSRFVGYGPPLPMGCIPDRVYGVAGCRIGIFAYPHPLHNIFGISELIGYQAPLVFALTWRRDPRANTLVALSSILFVLIWGAIALNLSSFDSQGPIWAYVRPVHGLAQRALFAAWFGWCAVVGILLFQHTRSIDRERKISPPHFMEI